ncbi:MAG TPA: GMC family oxidoreductase [Chloroflexota bacterium]|nr:GMC family oxidoreductase [Chloroflexota bacterium]
MLRLEVDGRSVERVIYVKDGRAETVAGDKIVLCGGSFHTPQLLMLSGIGPAEELERHGIQVRHRLDGVGENYQDHAMVFPTFEGRVDFQHDWGVSSPFRLLFKSDPNRPVPDFHIMIRPPTEVAGLKQTMPVSAALLEQRNRGRLSLQSADIDDLPLVDAQMLDHPGDVEAVRAAMQFIHDLTQHDSMKDYYGPMLQPTTKEDWATFARSTFNSYAHASGTCMMGPTSNAMAVVDQNLRVHGMDNLWLADASIMPTVVHANTNLTAIMIGERLSDFLKQEG